MKWYNLCLLICLCLLVLFGCNKEEFKPKKLVSQKFKINVSNSKEKVRIGKNIPIIIEENEVIDAKYLQKVLEGDIKRKTPFFDLWDATQLKKMIDYMDKNNLILAPGEYEINQSWAFEDGFFILPNNAKREVVKFIPLTP